jgi:hypothetical protein
MSSDNKIIGGEFGQVRANIDVETLTGYLLKNVETLRGPIDVKQFKVSRTRVHGRHTNRAFSLDRYAANTLHITSLNTGGSPTQLTF